MKNREYDDVFLSIDKLVPLKKLLDPSNLYASKIISFKPYRLIFRLLNLVVIMDVCNTSKGYSKIETITATSTFL